MSVHVICKVDMFCVCVFCVVEKEPKEERNEKVARTCVSVYFVSGEVEVKSVCVYFLR